MQCRLLLNLIVTLVFRAKLAVLLFHCYFCISCNYNFPFMSLIRLFLAQIKPSLSGVTYYDSYRFWLILTNLSSFKCPHLDMYQAILNQSWCHLVLNHRRDFFSRDETLDRKHFSIRRQRGSALRGREKLLPLPSHLTYSLCRSVNTRSSKMDWISS